MNAKGKRPDLVRIELTRQARAGAIELRWSTTIRSASVSACNGRILIQVGDAMLAVPVPTARLVGKGLETALRAREELGE